MHGIRPKKFLGQHFLRDQDIARKIVESLSMDNPVVFEIGPGTGVLTRFLIQRPIDKLILVEIDRDSNEYLKTHFKASDFQLVESDFLKLELSSLQRWEYFDNRQFSIPYIKSDFF
ncbi:MAG: rRNA adenine N-6-methyltransferase family protein [Cyclobacteriaceae bacterium]|nr:rRNA adenine N-6-methyltransferase family protein [Cyclobacteriaceae bacterium]